MIDAAPEPIFSLDARDGRITTLNQAFTELTGWPGDAWVGQPLTPLIHPSDLAATFTALHQTLAGETPSAISVRLRTTSGEHKPVELALSPLVLDDDVTHLRGMIRPCETPLNADSPHVLDRQPADLSVDAWLPVLLAESAALHDQLASVAADPDRRLAQLSELEAVWGSALELLATLADLVQLEDGKAELASRPFAILELFDELMGEARATAAARRQTLHSQLPTTSPPSLLGDPSRLRRLVTTALTWAAGQGRGSTELTVELSEVEPQRYEARLTVAAAGDDEDRSASVEMTRLARLLCRRLCQRLDGQLDGAASVLTLILGFEAAAADALPKSTTTPSSGDETTARSSAEASKARILVAEDQVVQQKMVSLMLERMGYEAEVETSGLDVLDTLAREPYDIVLLNRELEELDGLATSRSIRQRWPGDRRPWIIVMCAEPLQPEERRLVDDTVAIPLVKAELTAALEKHRRAAAEPGDQTTGDEPPPIDFDTLKLLYDLQPDKVRQLVDNFLTHGKEQVAALAGAARDADAAETQSIAHSLKGSSSTLGAVRLSALCLMFERRAKSESLDDVEDELTRLENSFAEVERAFRDQLALWDAARD